MKKHIFHLSHRSSTTILNLIISRNLSNVTYPQVASLGCCFIPALQAAQSSAVWTELVCKKTLTLSQSGLDFHSGKPQQHTLGAYFCFDERKNFKVLRQSKME
jgi:hypothetical protein